MKKKIFIPLLALLCSACNSVLDKEPLEIISDAVVWQDQALINAYLTEAYLLMYILENETPNTAWESSDDWNGPFIVNELSDESRRNWIVGQSEAKFNGIQISGNVLEWWEHSYRVIRHLNEFIERVPHSPVDDRFKVERVAEARFLRAYNYFAMVKRYGGVPLITTLQTVDTPQEELYPERNKEQEVYDFVISEMDAIISDLPERADTELGRPSRYAALALKCRAALYAGSIAQYGSQALDGVLGIASSPESYYQIAYDAAKEIMESGQYALYNADADKVQNFKNVFLVKNNPEAIWFKQHDYVQRNQGGNGWVWDFFQCPKPHAWNAGNQNAPYLEMAESFEYVDGRPGTLDREALEQGLWDPNALWEGKDPRFFATIYTQGTPWKGSTVEYYTALILPDGSELTSGSYNGVMASGTSADRNLTGFGVMKYLEESKDNMGERATSGTNFLLFRYAEILLNFAEAAYELGRTGEALDAINQVRERAGIKLLSSLDREQIRNERKVELAFEGHRYWDLRRWRIATDVLTVNRSGLGFKKDYASGKYKISILEKVDGANRNPVFYDYNYYFPITNARTANNPNLVENPGYQ